MGSIRTNVIIWNLTKWDKNRRDMGNLETTPSAKKCRSNVEMEAEM